MTTLNCDVAKHATLNTSDTVNVLRETSQIIVLNRGSVEIYYRIDGVAPTVGGDDCKVVPAGTAVAEKIQDEAVTVKLISVSSCAYSVMAA